MLAVPFAMGVVALDPTLVGRRLTNTLTSARLLGRWEADGEDRECLVDGRGVKLAEVFRLRQVRLIEIWVYQVGKFRCGGVQDRQEAKRRAETLVKKVWERRVRN